MKLSDSAATAISVLGGLLLVVGVASLTWPPGYFESLFNYQRLALASLVLCSKPLLFVDWYRQAWSLLGWRQKLYAVLFLVTPPITALAALVWYFVDPGAKA